MHQPYGLMLRVYFPLLADFQITTYGFSVAFGWGTIEGPWILLNTSRKLKVCNSASSKASSPIYEYLVWLAQGVPRMSGPYIDAEWYSLMWFALTLLVLLHLPLVILEIP